MPNFGVERFPDVESAELDVAFISGRQGVNQQQLRQNQEKQDDLPPSEGSVPTAFSEQWPVAAEGGSGLVEVHPVPGTTRPEHMAARYLGGIVPIV